MSPAKLDSCVKKVSKKIKAKEIPRTYVNKGGKRVKTNPYAICYTKKKTKGGKK